MTSNIRDLIADDSYAISFQSLVQYRSALLKVLDSQRKTPGLMMKSYDFWMIIVGDLLMEI